MSFPNNEQWLFVVEWFDPQPQMKKQFLLKYFVETHFVEMVDIKLKKMFLKKSACPAEIAPTDFFIGGSLLLYSRELTIVDYGDSFTRNKFAQSIQRVVAIFGQDVYSQWGAIADEMLEVLLTLHM
jgi:nucleoside-diphosphate kinase